MNSQTTTKELDILEVNDFCVVTDYVANGSFASLRENVTYRSEPSFAILVRLKDHTNQWNGNYVYVDESSYKFLAKSSVQPGDIVISNVGDPGKLFLVPDLGMPMTLGPNSILVRPDQKFASREYLFRYFQSEIGQEQIRKIVTATAQRKFNKTSFRKIKIPLPPLPEQKRIATILVAADALRTKRRESIALLDELLQSTFLDLFGDPVTNPKGWNIEPLGELCDVRDGTHDSPKYVNTGFPLLTSKNFKDGKIDFSNANIISEKDFHNINKRSKVDVGDLVMPMIGTIGNPVLIEKEPVFAIKNVALIKFNKNSPNNKFVKTLLCSHYFDYITSKANRGGTQKFVALKDLRGMPIPIPPRELQEDFENIGNSIESHKQLLEAHQLELLSLFNSLQSRAFKGEL